jgi:hypothetical protein
MAVAAGLKVKTGKNINPALIGLIFQTSIRLFCGPGLPSYFGKWREIIYTSLKALLITTVPCRLKEEFPMNSLLCSLIAGYIFP